MRSRGIREADVLLVLWLLSSDRTPTSAGEHERALPRRQLPRSSSAHADSFFLLCAHVTVRGEYPSRSGGMDGSATPPVRW
jgi:hypothetical protein